MIVECKHEKGLDAVVYEDLEHRFVNEDCVVSYHCAEGCGDIFNGEVVFFPKDQEEIREWISVKDRLPDEDGHYLVLFQRKLITTDWHEYSIGYFRGTSFDNNDWNSVAITHWMHLPKSPNE